VKIRKEHSPTFKNFIRYNTLYTPTGSEAIGTRYWNAVKGTTSLVTASGSILDDGQEVRYYGKASGNILNGQLVQFAGNQGDHVLFKVVVPAEVIANPKLLMGVATHDIANGEFGNVCEFGYVNDIPTYAWSQNDLLYFDNVTGQLTNVAPVAPERLVLVAEVVKEETGSSSNGILLVRLTWGFRMSELEDVDGYAHNTNGQVLVFNNNDGTWNAEHILPDSSHYTGWDDSRDSIAISFNNADRTLTLTGSISVYIDGVKYTKTNDSKQIADTTGMHYLYYTVVAGVLTLTDSVGTFPGFDTCLAAFVYWNTTIDKGIAQAEYHWFGRDQWTHEYLHETIGSRYASGLGGTFATASLSIGEGEFYDEDIEHAITTQTDCDILYKNGSANWEWDESQTLVAKVVSSKLQWNNSNTLTAANTGEYIAYWVYATASITNPIQVIIGQRIDTNIANARANNVPSSLTLGTLPVVESKLLFRVIYRQTGTSTYEYVETADYRTVSNSPTTSYTATDHSSLSNLAWLTSGHNGTVSTLAGFDSVGSATNYTEASYMLVDGSRAITGDLTVQGDLIVNGDQIIENVEELLVEDNLIVVNNGEVGAGVTAGYAGISVDRGSSNDYSFFFRESDDLFRVGETIYERNTAQAGGGSTTIKLAATTDHASANFYDGKKIILVAGTSAGDVRTVAVGGWNNTTKILTVTSAFTATPDATTEYEILVTDNTQAVATRQDTPLSAGIAYWNDTDKRFDTSSNATLTSAGAITLASTMQATTVKLTDLTDGYVPYHVSDASGLANSVIYQSSSLIGIGTTAQTELLQVGGCIATSQLGSTARIGRFFLDNVGNFSNLGTIISHNLQIDKELDYTSTQGSFMAFASNGDISLGSSDTGAGARTLTTHMTLDVSSGYLGINIASPESLLDIRGTGIAAATAPILTLSTPNDQAITTGSELGQIQWSYDDNSSGRIRQVGARIHAYATEAHDGSNAGTAIGLGVIGGASDTVSDGMVLYSTASGSQNLGAGIVIPTARIHSYSSGILATQATGSLRSEYHWNPEAEPATVYPTIHTIIGYYGSAYSPSGGYMIGQYNYFYNEANASNGTIPYVAYDIGYDNQTAAGTVTSLRYLTLRNPVNATGGTITQYEGLYVVDVTSANITTARALDLAINLASGKTRYNVYAPGTAYNYFNGNVGIGIAVPSTARFQIEGTGGTAGTELLRTYTDTTGTFSAVQVGKARGNQASPTAAQSGDTLGRFSATGYGATAWGSSAAMIDMIASENWTDAAHGTYVTVSTTTIGGLTTTEKIRFTDAGTIFNEGGVSTLNFRVEGDTNSYLFFVDAGLDMVSIGTSAVASRFHVYENTSTTTSAAGLRIEQDGAGDARLGFALTGGAEYSFGIDASQSSQLVLSASSALGTTDVVKISSTGALYLYSSSDITCNAKVKFNAYTEFDDESAHPADDPYGTVQWYVKGGLLIARFDDGGTIRYKYLNMAGTGTTWTHTTSAP
jgi:hypothetical protein